MVKRTIIIGLITLVASTCFSQTFNQPRMDSLFKVLEEKDKFMGSIAVSQNGKTIYTNAIGYADMETSKKADSKTRYRIGSISKMFTAALVLRAVEENKLSLNQTLDKYFPQIENAGKITIENLLRHRSGIHDFTNDASYLDFYTRTTSEKEMIKIIAGGKSDFEPNSKAAYSNPNFILLSYILEKIYNKPYASILHTTIVKPLGLKNTSWGGKTNIQNNDSYSYRFKDKWTKEAETDLSIPMGAGGIVSTPADLTIFIEQLFAGKIISNESLAVMKTINDGYGMGIIKFSYFDKKGYGHTGGIDGFQSELCYFPEEKISVALTSNGLIYPADNVVLCALSSCFNKPFAIPTFKVVTLKPEDLDVFLGQYASTQMPLKITITKKENNLVAQATGQSAFQLDATAPTIFQFERAGIVLEFNADKRQMLLKQAGKEFVFTKE